MLQKGRQLLSHSLLSARSLRVVLGTRLLSSAETKAALKPFYFAVHPDLFCQFPTQRAINEDSLKILNSYIDNLEKKFPVNPTHLTFYLKNEDAEKPQEQTRRDDEFKTVRISLFSRDLGFTVSQILKSCGMIQDFVSVNRTTDDNNAPYGGPLDWLHLYRQFGDKRSAHRFESKPEITLKDFLDSHRKDAKERLQTSKRNREEMMRLLRTICSEFGLKDLVVDCGWSCLSCLGSLRNFHQLCREKSSEVAALKGRRVMFGSWTGVDPRGTVMLSIRDVPQFWLALVGALEDYDVLVHQVPLWERRLSTALGSLQIRNHSNAPSTTVTEYLNYLHRVTMSLRRINYGRTGHAVNPGTYKDLTASIHSPTGSLVVSSCGEIRIPASTPGDMLVDFLEKNKNLALEHRQERDRNVAKEEQLIKTCTDTLQLNALVKDESVSCLQMISCCSKLAQLPSDNLAGLRVLVSKYYHCADDGSMSIPWDWK